MTVLPQADSKIIGNKFNVCRIQINVQISKYFEKSIFYPYFENTAFLWVLKSPKIPKKLCLKISSTTVEKIIFK